jgi:hypothetical protein
MATAKHDPLLIVSISIEASSVRDEQNAIALWIWQRRPAGRLAPAAELARRSFPLYYYCAPILP